MRSLKRSEEINTLGEPRRPQGWGADLSPLNRPGVPKETYPHPATGSHWDEPDQQEVRVKIHRTLERPALTPVFGTTCPPRGLSGLLRNFAYRSYSENRLSHWLLLLLADRVDMVEGFWEDLARGKKPSLLPRMEFRTGLKLRQAYSRSLEGKTDPKAAFLAGAALAGLAYVLLRKRD